MDLSSRNLYNRCQCLFTSKRAVCAKYLFKRVIINSSKSVLTRLYSIKRAVSGKNHYDVLEITPYATQNEIKSAYYKLSLQYHPDKNKSKYAKKKFQDISDAYEVLGNHEQRRIYDRQMIIHQPATNVKKSESKSKVYTGATKVYNFDAWTQAHYRRQFQIDRIRRNTYEEYKRMEELDISSERKYPFVEFSLYLLTLITFILFYFKKDYDIPINKKEKEKVK